MSQQIEAAKWATATLGAAAFGTAAFYFSRSKLAAVETGAIPLVAAGLHSVLAARSEKPECWVALIADDLVQAEQMGVEQELITNLRNACDNYQRVKQQTQEEEQLLSARREIASARGYLLLGLAWRHGVSQQHCQAFRETQYVVAGGNFLRDHEMLRLSSEDVIAFIRNPQRHSWTFVKAGLDELREHVSRGDLGDEPNLFRMVFDEANAVVPKLMNASLRRNAIFQRGEGDAIFGSREPERFPANWCLLCIEMLALAQNRRAGRSRYFGENHELEQRSEALTVSDRLATARILALAFRYHWAGYSANVAAASLDSSAYSITVRPPDSDQASPTTTVSFATADEVLVHNAFSDLLRDHPAPPALDGIHYLGS